MKKGPNKLSNKAKAKQWRKALKSKAKEYRELYDGYAELLESHSKSEDILAERQQIIVEQSDQIGSLKDQIADQKQIAKSCRINSERWMNEAEMWEKEAQQADGALRKIKAELDDQTELAQNNQTSRDNWMKDAYQQMMASQELKHHLEIADEDLSKTKAENHILRQALATEKLTNEALARRVVEQSKQLLELNAIFKEEVPDELFSVLLDLGAEIPEANVNQEAN